MIILGKRLNNTLNHLLQMTQGQVYRGYGVDQQGINTITQTEETFGCDYVAARRNDHRRQFRTR